MSFPHYEKYKDSGVEWLGEVPEEWTVASLKHGYSIIGGSTPKSDSDTFWDGDIVWVTPADLSKLPGLEVADSARKITQVGLDSCGTSLVPSGSVILSTRAPIGTLGIAAKSLCTNQGCKALVPQGGQNSRYCIYLLLVSTGELSILGRGTTFLELSGDALGKFPFPFPPLPEQTQIARFLDHETAKTDALIREQERLIELLQEKRQAVISHAVTKGLDPDVPMKNSGVEWLGEVPAHWITCGITRYLEPIVDYRGKTPEKSDEGVFLVTAKNIKNGEINYEISKEYITPEAYSQVIRRGTPKISDVVLTTEAPLGEVANIDKEDIALAQRVVKLRGVKNKVDNYFLKWMIKSNFLQSQLESKATGSTALGIKGSKIGELYICLPPINEQKNIAARLQKLEKSNEKLLDEALASIKLLKERRSALISAAVTGKIDVRGWQPPADESAFAELGAENIEVTV
jgi:type I restriction enzyme S subunit